VYGPELVQLFFSIISLSAFACIFSAQDTSFHFHSDRASSIHSRAIGTNTCPQEFPNEKEERRDNRSSADLILLIAIYSINNP